MFDKHRFKNQYPVPFTIFPAQSYTTLKNKNVICKISILTLVGPGAVTGRHINDAVPQQVFYIFDSNLNRSRRIYKVNTNWKQEVLNFPFISFLLSCSLHRCKTRLISKQISALHTFNNHFSFSAPFLSIPY
jgi:hypothetical protein